METNLKVVTKPKCPKCGGEKFDMDSLRKDIGGTHTPPLQLVIAFCVDCGCIVGSGSRHF